MTRKGSGVQVPYRPPENSCAATSSEAWVVELRGFVPDPCESHSASGWALTQRTTVGGGEHEGDFVRLHVGVDMSLSTSTANAGSVRTDPATLSTVFVVGGVIVVMT